MPAFLAGLSSALIFSVLPHDDRVLVTVLSLWSGGTLLSSTRWAWGYRQARGRWSGHGGAHTQTTHTHTDRAPAYTRSSTHIEAGINDSASLKYICMYVYFCVCFLVHHDWIIMPNGRTACWCITGSILFEQGHWMASCQGVMNVIYTCRLNKERKAYWDLDILTSS